MRIGALLAVACCAVALLGCQRAGAPAPSTQSAGTRDEEARLVAADAADGAADHVIRKCATCRLGMDGAPDITVAHRGYVLHFCSADCKQTFERDPGAVIRELPAPRS